jgi:uncharacterized protein involved in outer membrane biogenesis
MTGLLRSRLLWAAAALAGLVGLYAFVGYRVAPGWLRTQAIEHVRKTYGRELRIGAVRVDPFRLQLEVQDLAFPDADGQAMLGFRRLFVDFQLASLWRRALVFRDVGLDAPLLRAVIRPDGAMNLADLAPAEAAPPAAPADDTLPAIWIESLEVGEGRADYVDLTARRRPIAHTFSPVSFTLKDFRTTPEGGSFSLSAASDAGERFAWKGRFALAPAVNSDGEFSIGGLRAMAVADLLGDALPFDVSAGSIDLAGSYRLALGDATALELSIPSVALSGLSLRALGLDEDWVSVPRLLVSGTRVAMPAQTVAVERVELAEARVRAWLAADGSLNLARLAAGPAAPAPAPAAAPRPGQGPAPSAAPARPWSVQLGELALRGAAVDFEDRSRPPTKTFAIAPLNLTVRKASLDLSKPLPVSMDATINGRSRLELAGSLTPEPLSTELDVALKGARLQILQPYILPLADLTVRSGTLDGSGRLRYAPPAAGRPGLSFEGNLELADFRSTDNALGQDLVSFGRVRVAALRYTMAPDALSIDRIDLTRPYARLVIGPEGVLNLSAVLDPEGARAEIESRRRAAAEQAEASGRNEPRRGKRSAAKRPQPPKAKRDKAAARPVAPPPAAPTPEGMPIRIREVRIDGGRLNFSDLNIRPNFSADILDLQGSLRGLSSAFESRATVDLTGNLGEFSPVTIGGTIQPFAFDRHTDVALDFRNISLPVFNPYSGRFAGYSIAKGKLDTQLRYRIEDRRLKADHSLRIDQLEWGEASAERGEASLPVKFATALLRDRNGVIALNVPVGGTLDDPKLRVGPIVWQIIKNLIVKAVTAPFALIGSLFKGAEEAQFIDFVPGESTIDPAEAERLGALARGLAEKAGISLDVPIGASAQIDGPALAEQAYARALAAASREVAGIKDPAAAAPAFDALPHRTRVAALGSLLRARTGAVPEVPEPPAPPEDTPRAEARAAAERAEVEFLEAAARKAVPAEAGALEALAEARARSIERALLAEGKLEPGRVFLTRNGKVAPKDGKLRFELALK